MPVAVNEPLSFLQRMVEYLEYAELLAAASQADNPVHRLEVCYVCSLHCVTLIIQANFHMRADWLWSLRLGFVVTLSWTFGLSAWKRANIWRIASSRVELMV